MNEILKPLFEYELFKLKNLYNLSEIQLQQVNELVKIVNEFGEDVLVFGAIDNLLQMIRNIDNRDLLYLSIWLQSTMNMKYDYDKFKNIYNWFNRDDFYEIDDYIIFKDNADLAMVFSDELECILNDYYTLDEEFLKSELIDFIIDEIDKDEILEELIDRKGVCELLGLKPKEIFTDMNNTKVYYIKKQ